jgi:hypothetical protein
MPPLFSQEARGISSVLRRFLGKHGVPIVGRLYGHSRTLTIFPTFPAEYP